MTDDRAGFRQKLFESQDVTPALRAAYDRDVDTLLHDTPTLLQRAPAIALFAVVLAVVVGEARALAIQPGRDFPFYVGAGTMFVVCATAAAWLLRDICTPKVAKKSALQMSEMFYGAAATLLVVSLMRGLGDANNPASMFNAFYVFAFLFVCSNWAMGNRITASEIAVKEQLLRLECRLADLSEARKS